MEPITNDLETITKGRWQWKSNADPWSKTEDAKWKPYSLEHNYLIEKAYYDQQKEVDLGDYLVYPLEMLQRKKGNSEAQRPIRRVDWMNEEETIDRSERYSETELPKTINKIFGSLGDFITFFSRRNPEILDFTKQFKELEQSKDLNPLNQKIIPKLVECFEEGLLKPNSEQLQNPLLSPFRKKVLLKIKERSEGLILLFQKEFKSVEEFYGQILRAYTMDTDLYPSLNRYLRNESWHEIDKLLPYAFCLCKAFFYSRLKKNLVQNDSVEKPKTSSSTILYRGTAFDEFAINLYDKKTVEYFSWNAVTSASTNKNVAQDFMYRSADLGNKKYPVMFIIEIPLPNEMDSEYLKWIDIHQYSAIPKEDEVILAPGSVFELIAVFIDQDKKTTIKIRLRDEIKSLAYGGLMMQGALQSQITTEKEAKIVCSEGEEFYQALTSLQGNSLIEEVEFSLCVFDRKSVAIMIEILPSMKNAKTLKLISCMSQDDQEIFIEKPKGVEKCEIEKIEILGAENLFQLVCNKTLNQEYWVCMSELNLYFNHAQNEEVKDLISQGAKYLTKLASLSMKFEEGKYNLEDTLVERGSLTFSRKSLHKSQHPKFNENPSRFIPGESSFGPEQQPFYDIASSVSGKDNTDLTFKIQTIFCKASSLTYLTLDFTSGEITDEGIENLASQGLKNLIYLKSLVLHFWNCKKITEKGIDSLASQGLKHLVHLTSLGLFFNFCVNIKTQGLQSLAIEGLQYLTELTSLKLNMMGCHQITDEGVESLAFYGLKNLSQLRTLMITLNNSYEITDKGIESLAIQGLKGLTQLTELLLEFSNITDKGLNKLILYGIKNLSQLTSLRLTFPCWKGVSNFSIQNIIKVCHYLGYELRK